MRPVHEHRPAYLSRPLQLGLYDRDRLIWGLVYVIA